MEMPILDVDHSFHSNFSLYPWNRLKEYAYLIKKANVVLNILNFCYTEVRHNWPGGSREQQKYKTKQNKKILLSWNELESALAVSLTLSSFVKWKI